VYKFSGLNPCGKMGFSLEILHIKVTENVTVWSSKRNLGSRAFT
jgi:hypothetical protein